MRKGTISGARWLYSASAIGAAAYIDRIDDATLSYEIPVQGASALCVCGGVSESLTNQVQYSIQGTRALRALSADSVQTFAVGRPEGDRGLVVRAGARINGFELAERIRVDSLEIELQARALMEDRGAKVSVVSPVIERLRLDAHDVRVFWREDLLGNLNAAKKQDSLVRAIEISGAATRDFVVDGNTILWRNVGRIALGEVGIVGDGFRVTMLRVELGSPIAGWGVAAEARCALLLPGEDPTPIKG
jgi:hypothetical protein